MKKDKVVKMNIEEKKEKLIKKEISISDLNSNEVEVIKKSVKEELEKKRLELNNINLKIRNLKTKIDNWSN